MRDERLGLNQRIASRVRDLRDKQHFSLAALADKTGVSRSMISLIERGESSPTAVVLEKLAAGLNVTLASLFESPDSYKTATNEPVARLQDQPQWKDPASGYVRRNISPAGIRQPAQIVEIHFPPRQRVIFESPPREAELYQQIWMLEGTMNVTLNRTVRKLQRGDCLAMKLEESIIYHNPTRRTARYAVIKAGHAVWRQHS